jgi:hypothetical protein
VVHRSILKRSTVITRGSLFGKVYGVTFVKKVLELRNHLTHNFEKYKTDIDYEILEQGTLKKAFEW